MKQKWKWIVRNDKEKPILIEYKFKWWRACKSLIVGKRLKFEFIKRQFIKWDSLIISDSLIRNKDSQFLD